MTASLSMRECSVDDFLNEISDYKDTTFVSKNYSDKVYKQLLTHASSSITKFANLNYKPQKSLEITDIERIKASLNKFVSDDDQVLEYKQAILEDLTSFQNKIKTTHAEKVNDVVEEIEFCDKQIKIFEFAKNKIVMERLAKAKWPYDAKTKEYDKKIALLQTKKGKLQEEFQLLKNMRPMVKEEEIEKFQLELERKFS